MCSEKVDHTGFESFSSLFIVLRENHAITLFLKRIPRPVWLVSQHRTTVTACNAFHTSFLNREDFLRVKPETYHEIKSVPFVVVLLIDWYDISKTAPFSMMLVNRRSLGEKN